MRHIRQLIPPLSLREAHGRSIHAWDFKQKQNLVPAFLDVGCSLCEAFIRALANHATDPIEKDAVILLVFPAQPEPSTRDILSEEMFAGAASPHDMREFLGEGRYQRKDSAGVPSSSQTAMWRSPGCGTPRDTNSLGLNKS